MSAKHARSVQRRFAVLLVGSMIASAFTPGSQTSAAELPSPAAETTASRVWPGVRDIDGTELATISVKDSSRMPLRGAVVVASLWPSFDARKELKEGDTFQATPIDRIAVVNGLAEIHAGDDGLLKAHQSKDATITIFLDIFTEQGEWTTFRLQRTRNESGRWVDPEATSDPLAAVAVTVDDQALATPAPASETAAPQAVTRHHQGAYACSAFTSLSSVSVPETVATGAVINGIRAKLTYTSSAQTTSSIGASLDAGATWSINGSSTRSSGLTASYNTVTGANGSWTKKEWRASWQHKRYYRHCPYGPNGAAWHEQRYTEPVSVVGFPAIIDSRYALPGCHTKHPLSGVNAIATDNATAMTYGAAFKITWGATFSGSARSGWTAAVQQRFERPTSSGYWYWCGNTYDPKQSAWLRAGR